MNYNKIINWLSYAFFVFAVLTASSIFFADFSDSGYKNSPLAPPQWFFFFIWTALFILIGFSLRRVHGLRIKNKVLALPTILFIIQLLINLLWGLVFGFTRSLSLSPIILLFAWFFILTAVIEFYKIDKRCAYLMVPYLAWVNAAVIVSIATAVYN